MTSAVASGNLIDIVRNQEAEVHEFEKRSVRRSWAAVSFCRTTVTRGVTLSLIAHFGYWAVLALFGVAIAMVHDLVW